MKTYFVVTGVVKYKNNVLILKKSPKDWNYPGKWSFCSGYVKEFESAEDTVLREVKEKTLLNSRIIKKGRLFQKDDRDKGKSWVIKTFLCGINSKNIKLDHENTEFKWINPEDLGKYPAVPGLKKDLKVLNLI